MSGLKRHNHYVEFFHGVPGTDNDISDQYATKQNWEEKARARIKNTNLLMNLNQMRRAYRQAFNTVATKLGQRAN